MAWRETIDGMSVPQILRAAYRKFVFRRVTMGMYEASAGQMRPPRPDAFAYDHTPASAVDFADLDNPNLTASDIEYLSSHPHAICIVARKGQEVAGSLWVLRDQAVATELGTTLDLGVDGHYFCRAYVKDSHRGHSLLSQMMSHYAARAASGERMMALIYDWNVASIRSTVKAGWRRSGTYWAVWVMSRRIGGVSRRPRDHVEASDSASCLILADQNAGSALHAARQLASRGVRTQVAAPKGWGATLAASRHVHAVREFDLSDPVRYCQEVLEWARGTLPSNVPMSVIPLSDRLVEYLDVQRGLLDAHFRLAIPDHEVARRLVTKVESLALAEGAGLDVPPWCVVSGAEDIERAVRLHFPVIVKPSAWSTSGRAPFKLEVVEDPTVLRALLDQVLDLGATVIVQEYIQAPDGAVEFGLTWRSQEGKQTVVCSGTKRRQSSPAGGIMAWGGSSNIAIVRQLAVQFLDASGFVGVGGIEFIREGDRRWFIEFNPRPEAIHFLAEASGQPMIWWLHQDLTEQQVDPNPTQSDAAAWVGAAWLERIRQHPQDIVLWWRDRLAFMRAPRRTFAVWDIGDPLPAAVFVRRIAVSAARSLLRRSSEPILEEDE